jgi:nitroreductase
MDTLEAIRTRRSVRSYTGGKIPRADLETLVDAARLAPSGNNKQPWDFIVVTDEGMINQLKIASQWMDKAAAIIAVVMDPSSRWWVEDASAAVENMLLASVALGYGACWLEGYTCREKRSSRTVGHPKTKRLITLVPVGVPAEGPVVEKKPLSKILHWELYGAHER